MGLRDCAELYKNKLRHLYCRSDIIWYRRVGCVARMMGGEKACTLLPGNPEGKRPLGRPRRRWKGDVKPDRKKKYIVD